MEDFGLNTVKTIKTLRSRGIHRMLVVLRHSARFYRPNMPKIEPFLGLTEEGKDYSLRLGSELPTDTSLRLFSSPVGRCIETAYLVDKGNTAAGGRCETNKIKPKLTAFYVKDIAEIFKGIKQRSIAGFFRDWFDGKVPEEVMGNPLETRDIILDLLLGILKETNDPVIDIAISHDWYMYVLKEHFLKQPLEEFGQVQYLEGAAIFEKQGKLYIVNHQSDPVPIEQL